MKFIRVFTLLVIAGLLLSACTNPSSRPAVEANAPTAVELTATPAATSAAPTGTPTQPEPTVTPPQPTETVLPTSTPTAEPAGLDVRETLIEVIQNPAWATLGMDAGQASRWEEFARSGTGLSSQEELDYVNNFVAQWQQITTAAKKAIIPDGSNVGYRVVILDHETGGPEPVLYPVVVSSEFPEAGASKTGTGADTGQLFLIARDRKDQLVGLVAAPMITGLRQQVSADGQHVEYIDIERGVHLLSADARKLTTGRQSEEVLLDMLEAPYSRLSAYTRSALYPRYFFPIEGVDASFYTLETLLTYPQITQMYEAFQLLDRPEFAALKDAIFQEDTSVTIIEESGTFLGVTYLGTGVMQLNRRDLLGNKYELVGVLAHEGAHILQKPPTGGDACKNSLRREIGDRTIPDGFFDWTADQVVAGIEAQKIGAYHTGFWVLQKLGVLEDYWPIWRELIRTGKVGTHWISAYCP